MLGVWLNLFFTIPYRSIEYPAVLEVLLRQHSSQSARVNLSLKRYGDLSIEYVAETDVRHPFSHSSARIDGETPLGPVALTGHHLRHRLVGYITPTYVEVGAVDHAQRGRAEERARARIR